MDKPDTFVAVKSTTIYYTRTDVDINGMRARPNHNLMYGQSESIDN